MKSRIVGALVRMGSCILELLTLKERKKAKQEARADAEAPVKAAEDIRHAVATGDEAKVNQMLESARLNLTHGGKAVSVALAALALAGSVLLQGCALPQRRPLVLSADRACVRMEMNGVQGWFVPSAQFADLSAAYVAEQARMKLREQAMEAANGDF